MTVTIRQYLPEDCEDWDAFCERTIQGTFLHTRAFLSYHGDRFKDRSLIIECNGKWVGILPAALSLTDSQTVVSHPGITYGAVLHKGDIRGAILISIMAEIVIFYRSQGLNYLVYKAVPTVYHQAPAQDDLYALYRFGAKLIRCDLSCSIDLLNPLPMSSRRKRGEKKARRAGVEIVEGKELLPAFWEIVTTNLSQRHSATPTHTADEIALLADRFPDRIKCVCAELDGSIIAGVLLFITPTVHHAQYIASNEKGFEFSALDLLFNHCLTVATIQAARYFDFGISNEKAGSILNDGLYRFKSEFGGGGIVHNFFQIDLTRGVQDAAI